MDQFDEPIVKILNACKKCLELQKRIAQSYPAMMIKGFVRDAWMKVKRGFGSKQSEGKEECGMRGNVFDWKTSGKRLQVLEEIGREDGK